MVQIGDDCAGVTQNDPSSGYELRIGSSLTTSPNAATLSFKWSGPVWTQEDFEIDVSFEK